MRKLLIIIAALVVVAALLIMGKLQSNGMATIDEPDNTQSKQQPAATGGLRQFAVDYKEFEQKARSGMTPSEVEETFGKPDRIVKTPFDDRVLEQWCYGETRCIFLVNGKSVGFSVAGSSGQFDEVDKDWLEQQRKNVIEDLR